ncbi:MAG: hypothetical protein ACR2QU_00340, partial [Gammaproteobacteria bacterium]
VTPELELTPELAKTAKATEPKKPAAPQPVAQVSEMTARIAALDSEKRSDDVESLEAALDAAKTGQLEKMMAPPPLPDVTTEEVAVEETPAPIPEVAVEEPPAPIPEITLDDKIVSKPAPRPVPQEHLAEIGQAQSLEEFSDAMAETLFGNEDLDLIAAAVVANPPADAEANAAQEPGTDPSGEPPAIAAELTLAVEEPVAEKAVAETPAPVAPVARPAAKPPPTAGGLRESQQMRADMLQSLNTDKKPAGSKPAAAAAKTGNPSKPGAEPIPGQKEAQPESIENQINTSITQTLEALDVAKMAESEVIEEEEKEEKKGGLFSRFRKSS